MKRLLSSIVLLLAFIVAQAQQQVTHTVMRGETLESIALKYHVTVDAIKKNNPNIGDVFYVGLKLNIPAVEEVVTSTESKTEEIVPATSQPVTESHSYASSPNVTNQQYNAKPSQSVYFDTQCDGFELSVNTDKELKFEEFSGSVSWMFKSVFVELGMLLKSPNNDAVKNSQAYNICLGYNPRLHLGEYLFIDLRPSVFFSHSSSEIANGSELKETSSGNYHRVTTYEKKKSDSLGLLLEPRIGLQFNKFWLFVGYHWSFNKFKFKKEYKGEGVRLGIGFNFGD